MTTNASNSVKAAGIAALLMLFAGAAPVWAQPSFGNPSPTKGSSTSDKANAAADEAAYKEVEYTNKARKGPALVVIPGEIKSSHAGFVAKFGPNNIADFGRRQVARRAVLIARIGFR